MNTRFFITGLASIILGLSSSLVLAEYEWAYDEQYDFDDSGYNSSFVHTKPDSTPHVSSGYQWIYDEHYDFDSSADNSSYVSTKPDSTRISSGYEWVYNEHYDFDSSEDESPSNSEDKHNLINVSARLY